jgi:hypothetical protein
MRSEMWLHGCVLPALQPSSTLKCCGPERLLDAFDSFLLWGRQVRVEVICSSCWRYLGAGGEGLHVLLVSCFVACERVFFLF